LDEVESGLFGDTVRAYNTSLQTLDKIVNRMELGNAPLSYCKLFPSNQPNVPLGYRIGKDGKDPVPKNPRNGGKEAEKDGPPNPKHQQGAKGDWLLKINRAEKITAFVFPASVETFCLQFAIKGYTCHRGAPCRYPHVDYVSMADAQKEAIKAYVATNKAFKLAE